MFSSFEPVGRRSLRSLLCAVVVSCSMSGCSELLCDGPYLPAVTVEVRNSSGEPAAAGARAIVTLSSGVVDTAWASPMKFATHIDAGWDDTRTARVVVEKPWYEPVQRDVVGIDRDACGIVSSAQVGVELVLLPNAPRVRSVYVGRGTWGFSGSISDQVHAVVDVASGVSDSVTWWSSDTTFVLVDPTGGLLSRCVDVSGGAYVGATSVADPTVSDSFFVSVSPGSNAI